MAKVRWTGENTREVMVTVGDRVDQVTFERMEWQDVPLDVARSLNQQDGWELESVKKAQRTRAKGED